MLPVGSGVASLLENLHVCFVDLCCRLGLVEADLCGLSFLVECGALHLALALEAFDQGLVLPAILIREVCKTAELTLWADTKDLRSQSGDGAKGYLNGLSMDDSEPIKVPFYVNMTKY